MSNDLKKIVVRCLPSVHCKRRNRASFTFTDKPLEVSVTEEQYKLIEEDNYLKICKSGSAVEQGKENAKKKEQTKKKSTKKVFKDKKITQEDVDEMITSPSDSRAEKLLKALSKKDIIKNLESLGQKEGKDFDKGADKESLLTLLQSLK